MGWEGDWGLLDRGSWGGQLVIRFWAGLGWRKVAKGELKKRERREEGG